MEITWISSKSNDNIIKVHFRNYGVKVINSEASFYYLELVTREIISDQIKIKTASRGP